MRRSPVLLAFALIAMLGHGVHAADHSNLEEGLPTQVEDAFAIGYQGRELQGFARYERLNRDRNALWLEPRIEWGFARNAQATLAVPVNPLDEDTGSGDIHVGALYNFNQETLWLAAFALAGRLEIPTGRDSLGLDTKLKAIATKTLGQTTQMHRLHLNLAWLHNSEARRDERDDRYQAIFGYSVRLDADTMLVADYVREQKREDDAALNLLELGIRRQITPLAVISVGAGAGIGRDSPDFTLSAGFQWSF